MSEADSLLRALREVLAALVRRLPPESSGAVGELADWLAAEAARLARESAAPETGPDALAAAPSETVAEQTAPEPAQAPVRKVPRTLRLGGIEVRVAATELGSPVVAPQPTALRADPAPPPPIDLPAHEPEPRLGPRRDWARELGESVRSARLKARACELALRGARQSEVDAALRESRRLFDEAAPLHTCFLWPLDPRVALPEAPLLDLCARAYENLATAIEIALRNPAWVSMEEQADEDVLRLLAESQSALLWALEATDLDRDGDQTTAFVWLREHSYRHQVYIAEYLSLDSRADPTNWHDLAERLDRLARRLRGGDEERGERKRLVSKLRYHLGRVQGTPDKDLARREWSGVVRALDEWVGAGRPPSSREVCDLLVDAIDDLPDDLDVPEGAQRVLLALDEQIAARQRAAETPRRAEPRHAPEVAQARALLAGKVVLLIGGQRRAFEADRLQRDLGLAELRWISTTAHRSIAPLEEEIWKPDVALVVTAPRWSDHAFIELKQTAQQAGKPFLQLPGGYGTNQVAYQVMRQVSGQLGAAR